MARKGRPQKNENNRKSGNHDVLAIVLIVISAFLLLCIVIPPILSVVSQTVFSVLLGTFGIAIYPVLVAVLLGGILLYNRRTPYVSVKNGVCIGLLVFFALMILQLATSHAFLKQPFGEYIASVYNAKYTIGGVIMGTVAFGLKSLITEIACYVVFSVGILVVIAVMINVVSLIRNRKNGKKGDANDAEKAPAKKSRFTDERESKRVTAIDTPSKLYVGQIEPRMPAVYTETGTASSLPLRERREATDYSSEPLYSTPDTDRARSRNQEFDAARFALYGDSDNLTKRQLEEYQYNAEQREEEKREERQEGQERQKWQKIQEELNAESMRASSQQSVAYAEPYVKVNEDAKSNRPKRVDHDNPYDMQVLFPTQKAYNYSDEGIETAELDIKKQLSEDNEKRKQSEIENVTRDESRTFAPPPPQFSSRVDNDRFIRPDLIIDAPKDNAKSAPDLSFAQNSYSSDDSIITPGRSNDDLIKSLEELRETIDLPLPESNEIIDASELNEKFNEEVEPEQEEDIIADIIDGSLPYEEPAQESERDDIFDGRDIITENPPIAMGASGDSLIISDEPVLDMSESHDITSDLVDGTDNSGVYLDADDENVEPVTPAKAPKNKKIAPIDNQISIDMVLKEKAESLVISEERKRKHYDYVAPPLDFLKPSVREDIPIETLQDMGNNLAKFISGILKAEVKVLNIVPGPTVTRYELEVPPTMVKQIPNLSQSIEYELAAPGHVRIEAPILAKRAVGVEVPNAKQATISLREVLESDTFKKASSAKNSLIASLGVDIGGEVVCCNLSQIPHLLIGGQTGSGKSACLNGLITSLLYSVSPEDLRFILIDPKRVEFAKYRHMPHLLFDSIITEPNEVFSALKWASNEMERRYTVMAKFGCSNIAMYNELPNVKAGHVDKMAHIIIVIDEIADLMLSTAKHEIEERIKVISAKARAAGIHLILATQRPSVEVLTGTIRANMTAFIAFKVGKQIESRIILDTTGAEDLVGKGDMLYLLPSYPEPRRLQGTYISDPEVSAVVEYIINNYESDFDTDAANKIFNSAKSKDGGGGLDSVKEDPLFLEILSFCVKNKQASASSIQRRFSIGYARASRIVDYMGEAKYIGPPTTSSKPREVYMTPEQYFETFGRSVED